MSVDTGTNTETRPAIQFLPYSLDDDERQRFVSLGDSHGYSPATLKFLAALTVGRYLPRSDWQDVFARAVESFAAPDHWMGAAMTIENRSLRRRVEELDARVRQLEEQMPHDTVVVLRELTRAEATKEIRGLFASGRVLYYSDVARELRLDLPTVVEICEELRAKGEIETDGDSL